MGACVSSNVHDEEEKSGSAIAQVWTCLRLGYPEHSTDENIKATKRPSSTCGRSADLLQPQRRFEMDLRGRENTVLGPWLIPTQQDATGETHVVASPDTPLKKRKRSMSVVLRQSLHIRRPRTAPERPRSVWRVSLRSFATRSPFPDFSSFPLADDICDSRSSCTFVDTSAAGSSLPATPSWPLPRNLADHSSNAETDVELPYDGPSIHRSRAISDPFRYAKRIRAATVRSERQSISEEIQELRMLIEEKKRKTELGPAESSRTASFARPRSRVHIPAIAPAMKVNVRSQVLTDIGSAFSRPLDVAPTPAASAVTPSTTIPHDDEAVPREVTASESLPFPYPEAVYYQLRTSGPAAHIVRSEPNAARHAGHTSSTTTATTATTTSEHADRNSAATSISLASRESTASHFATEPPTPPLSAVSSAAQIYSSALSSPEAPPDLKETNLQSEPAGPTAQMPVRSFDELKAGTFQKETDRAGAETFFIDEPEDF